MSFGQAIKSFWANYANFKGRAPRSAFWWVQLFFISTILILEILRTISIRSFDIATSGLPGILSGLTSIFFIASIIPMFSLTVRRLHDINKSGWLTLIALIPIIGYPILLILMMLPSAPVFTAKPYNGQYLSACKVCWHNTTEDPTHECNTYVDTITHERNGVNGYEGIIRDGLQTERWNCQHIHDTEQEALNCASLHTIKHQRGECICTYFCPPIDENIKRAKNAYVYVMKNETLKSVKIGVSGRVFPHRVQEHIDNGWTFVAAYTGLDGTTAYQIEQGTIATWRISGNPKHLKAADMPQGGATETVSIFNVDINNILNEIEQVTGTKPVTVLPTINK